MSRLSIVVAVGGVVALGAGMAHAKATAEQNCQAERAKAAGAYASCQQQAQAKLQTVGDVRKFVAAASKCRVKYTGTWAKLQAKRALAGSSCIGPRFNDDGTTVTDNLTGLQWEKKTNDTTVHDVANVYTWCIDGNSDSACDNEGAADGSAFTDLLQSLNSGCFAGQCDWRLPTRDELQTILADAYTGGVCTTPSCVDATFGPTQASLYWSATPPLGVLPAAAWYVSFLNGNVDTFLKFNSGAARGVRGGL